MDSRPDYLIPAEADLADSFSHRLSPEHKREIRDLGSMNPADAVRASLACSKESYAFVPHVAAFPVFMFGVEPAGVITRTARVWMLATPEIKHHGVAVLRSARWGVERAFAVTGAYSLEQYIPHWYRVGLRFVQCLGFSIEPFFTSLQTPLIRVTLTKSLFKTLKKNNRKKHPNGKTG